MVLAAFLAAAAVQQVRAERADRDKPLNIESDRMNADDAKKTAVFEGRVVLTQGTLVIKADRLTLRQDKEGFQYGIAAGNLATFRQKRDGANEYIDGEAERIEYDGRADRVQFFERARLRRDTGDDVRGDYISYDSRTEYFTVQSAGDARAQGTDGRVRAVIMPKKREGDAREDSKAVPPPPAGRSE
jgi:lipopolysaccharide export system protein LptA